MRPNRLLLSAVLLTLLLAAGCHWHAGPAPAPAGDHTPQVRGGLRLIEANSWESFGRLNGVPCEEYWICDASGHTYRILLCYRTCEEGFLKEGAEVYGRVEPLTDRWSGTVIDSIWFAVRNHPFDPFRYYTLPDVLYRDVVNPNLGKTYSDYSSILLRDGILTMFHSGGDAAGSYDIDWVIDLRKMKATRIARAFEGSEDVHPEWLDLRKADTPTLEKLPKPAE